MHYSATKKAFYPTNMRSTYQANGSWPVDAIKVTDAEWKTYGQSQPPDGMQRGADEKGRPSWVPIPPDDLDTLAAKKRGEIDSAAARAVADIRSLYPDFERETWGDQEDEARAWTADNTAPTPTLTGIAEARGVTVKYLAPKVIEKADQYRTLATSVAGKRQRLEDDIAAALEAEDREGLEAIEWSNAE
ncbi:tail fiber assembly protein [Halomonas sp. CSM-2]|uniref:tail fiber assembly protein n=1 Tax=Halomonas sp. CSM-2 TaxID=1975722 RepID=UPI001593654A|nr:tail fiber assembly protein [Halomonas sp. CSM-2]